MPAASAVPRARARAPQGLQREREAAASPGCRQTRSPLSGGCSGSRVSLGQGLPRPALHPRAGARFPLPRDRVDIWAEHPGAGECSCVPWHWPGPRGKCLCPPGKAGCGVRNLFHVLGYGCCSQPCSYPPALGSPSLLCVYTPHQRLWVLHRGGRSYSGCPQQGRRVLCPPSDGGLGLHRHLTVIFIPLSFFYFLFFCLV